MDIEDPPAFPNGDDGSDDEELDRDITPDEPPWEADPADVVDQLRTVPLDDTGPLP